MVLTENGSIEYFHHCKVLLDNARSHTEVATDDFVG